MFFLYNSHPFYILSSEIDLRKNPHLRLLQFNFSLGEKKIRDSQDDVIRWFNSICESVTTKSLVVEVRGSSNEVAICNKIQDTLLALYERIETFSVYLTPGTKEKRLFSKLYEVGIVIEEDIYWDRDKQVVYCILSSYLSYPPLSFLASPILPSMSFYLNNCFNCDFIRFLSLSMTRYKIIESYERG